MKLLFLIRTGNNFAFLFSDYRSDCGKRTVQPPSALVESDMK